jgi:hypothetical protein
MNDEFQALGTNIRVVTCDISDRAQCEKMASFSIRDMPPVKGVVHAAMVLQVCRHVQLMPAFSNAFMQDMLVEHMELDDFEVALKPKMMGTQYLSEVLDTPSLDFFVMLSSAISALGTRGVANYSAGNGFQDTFANISRPASGAHYIAINLDAMKESGVLLRINKLDEMINAQGVIPLSNSNLFALLEYAMSKQAREDKCHQIVVGFNRESLTRASRLHTLENPMLSHLPRHDVASSKALTSETSLETIAAAQNIKELQDAIAESMVLQISTLVVLDVEQIARDIPMVDFGLDSLVVIEIKNWIARSFQASLHTSEIFDAPSIASLAAMIASRSLLVVKLLENGNSKALTKTDSFRNGELASDRTSNATVLPRQPVPNIDDTLARFFEVATALSDGCDEELETTRRNAHESAKVGGPGRRLHDRLVASANNTENENWYSTFFLKGNYRQDRTPLPHFFGAHSQPRTVLAPAELATKVALAALQCKQKIEADKIGGAFLADQALYTHLYRWLFNSCREPHVREGRLRKYESGDLVALRYGNCFKVMLKECGETITHVQLKATFEAILKIPREQESWVNLLTADGRDEWAEVRECSVHALNTL